MVRKNFTWLVLVSFTFLLPGITHSQVIMSLLFGDKLNSDEMSFGMHVDRSWNNLSNIKGSESNGVWNLGLYLGYKFNEKLTLNTEMMAKLEHGAAGISPYRLNNRILDSIYSNGSVERKLNYLGLPVTLQYQLNNVWYIETGPAIALRLKARDIFSTDTEAGFLQLDHGISDQTARWDFSWMAGMGIKTKGGAGPAVGIRYAYGFTDTDLTASGSQAHRAFSVYTNFAIGRAKALAKAKEKADK